MVHQSFMQYATKWSKSHNIHITIQVHSGIKLCENAAQFILVPKWLIKYSKHSLTNSSKFQLLQKHYTMKSFTHENFGQNRVKMHMLFLLNLT